MLKFFKFLVIVIRLYMAGFRISHSPFIYCGYHAKDEKKVFGDCGLHRFYWDYGDKVEVLDMPDLDWNTDDAGIVHYNLLYNGHVTHIN